MRTKAELEQKIRELIEEVKLGAVPIDRIQPQSRIIADLGLDSLDYATVMLGVEQWSGIKIKEGLVNWSTVQTVEQLAALFEAHQSR